jgi:hypothetical protein
VLELDPHLNVLVGVSNIGKSSVSRALSCLLFNQWDKSWVRTGSKFARISVTTDTGVEVIREKGEKINRYLLTVPGGQRVLYLEVITWIGLSVKSTEIRTKYRRKLPL